MIKAVLFDFSQTLVDSADGFRAAEKETQARLLADLRQNRNATISPDAFLAEYRRLRREFQAESNFSRKSLWAAVYRFFGCCADQHILEQWEEDYWRRVSELTRLFPETTEVLQALQREYRIALVTNTQGQPRSGGHQIIEHPELERFFESIIVAGESGIPAKPNPAAFEICLHQLNIAACEAVYVGDDWNNDICGALNAGLHAVWLKHRDLKRNWPAVATDVPTITDLRDLQDLHNLVGIKKVKAES